MSTNKHFFDMASLSEAAYAEFFKEGVQQNDSGEVKKLLTAKGWSASQADESLIHYRVISQQPNTFSGYSATLFERLGAGGTPTGQYVFAQRGTEPLVRVSPGAPFGLDLAVDIGDLVLDGLAWSQIVDMYNYWKELTTPAGQSYKKALLTQSPIPPASGGYVVDQAGGLVVGQQYQTIQLTSATAQACPNMPAGAALEVTGHSLGGHLASAFTRLFPGTASQAYTLNGVGYAQILGSGNIQYLFSQLGGATTFSPATVQNFRGSAGADIVAQNSGLVQVGASDQVFIEQGGLFNGNMLLEATAVFGHSATQLTDSAAVYDLFIQPDAEASTRSPTQYLPKLLGLFEAGANGTTISLEEVVRTLARNLGVDESPIATNDREALHARTKLLRDDVDFQSLLGQVVVRPQTFDVRSVARTDFGALVALLDLSPFSLAGKYAAGNAALPNVWTTTRSDAYASCDADKTAVASSTTPVNFTDNWIADRSAMLALIVDRNTRDITGISQGSQNIRYFDSGSNPDILVGAGSPQRTQYQFGSDSAETLIGQGFADHLYGGAGADILNGQGGNDYEEGGTGFETYTFTGAFGNDTLLDSDGQGQIKIGATVLGQGDTVGLRITEGIWKSRDKNLVYTTTARGLVIGQRSAPGSNTVSSTMTVQNWQSGQLGISLQDAPATNPTPPAHIYKRDRHAPLAADGAYKRASVL